ncbi:MAG: hypothetical protein V2I33_10645 [Kangiellaceae bacterium]|nr:hypothetical protein [Kangiellaceae bacterium]
MVIRLLLKCVVALVCITAIITVSANDKLVDDHFTIPVELKTTDFHLVKVDPNYSALDYKALMSARHFIRQQLGSEWPGDNFSLLENTESLKSDLEQFEQKKNFTYHIFNQNKSQIIGCVYISANPSENIDASVFIWMSADYLNKPFFEKVRLTTKQWIDNHWPFNKVDYSLNDAR